MKILTRIQKSKAAALIGLAVIMGVIVITMVFHAPWWVFIYLFLWFMSEFTHLGALFTERMNPAASRKLERVAFVCGAGGAVALIVVAVLLAAL